VGRFARNYRTEAQRARTILQSWLHVNSVQTTNAVAPEPVQQQTAANVMVPSEPPSYGYVKCSMDACTV